MLYQKQLSLDDFPEESQEKIKEMICPLCKGIYSEPIIDNCSHVFCRQCINIYINKNKEKVLLCPVGKNNLNPEKFKVFELVENLINQQDCYCTNKNNGCLWKGKYSKRKNHILKDCLFEIIDCKNIGCSMKIKRKEQNEHDLKCDYFLIECNKCHKKIPKINKSNHHKECIKEEIECKCKKKILREDLNEHVKNECPLEEIKCDFNIYGCNLMFKRSEKSDHEKKMRIEHNKIMINWFLEKKKKMELEIRKKENDMEEIKNKVNVIYKDIINLYNEIQ